MKLEQNLFFLVTSSTFPFKFSWIDFYQQQKDISFQSENWKSKSVSFDFSCFRVAFENWNFILKKMIDIVPEVSEFSVKIYFYFNHCLLIICWPSLQNKIKNLIKKSIKPEKEVPSHQNFYNTPPEIRQKPYGPSPWILKLCASREERNEREVKL